MVEVLLNIQMKMTWIIMNGAAIMIKNIIVRAETRTPGLTRKSNSTLSLVNDVDMEVPAVDAGSFLSIVKSLF